MLSRECILITFPALTHTDRLTDTHSQTHRHTDTHTDTHTHRHTQTPTHRHTHTHIPLHLSNSRLAPFSARAVSANAAAALKTPPIVRGHKIHFMERWLLADRLPRQGERKSEGMWLEVGINQRLVYTRAYYRRKSDRPHSPTLAV